MDPAAFDTLVRSLSTADTRRRVLGRLIALLPVTGLGLTLEKTAARGRSHGPSHGHHPGKGTDIAQANARPRLMTRRPTCAMGVVPRGDSDGCKPVFCIPDQSPFCCSNPNCTPARLCNQSDVGQGCRVGDECRTGGSRSVRPKEGDFSHCATARS
jgi:hypothetical protein